MFTNSFWTTDTDIMHPALSNMNCSIVETVDWVNNVIEILGPRLIIVYARRNVICSVMYDEEATTMSHWPMSVDMSW